MKPHVTMCAVAALAMTSALLLAQTPAGRNPSAPRRMFEIFTVEGQPIDKRPPQLETDHPVFPGQTHAPYHKTVDVNVTTIAAEASTAVACDCGDRATVIDLTYAVVELVGDKKVAHAVHSHPKRSI